MFRGRQVPGVCLSLQDGATLLSLIFDFQLSVRRLAPRENIGRFIISDLTERWWIGGHCVPLCCVFSSQFLAKRNMKSLSAILSTSHRHQGWCCVLCVVRKTVGLPDLHWIWILSEHWFTQPAIYRLPTAVSALCLDSQSQKWSPLSIGIQNALSISIYVPISIRLCIILLLSCFLFQLPRETVRRLLQRQCQTAGGGRGPDQRVLRCLQHPLLQNSFPQWFHRPLARAGNHAQHLNCPASCFHQGWEGTVSNCHFKSRMCCHIRSDICSSILN